MRIAVYGAAGHTARFVVAELLRRGHSPIAVARNEAKLAAVVGYDGTVERRVASLDSPDSVDRALAGADAVIHCAGPFLDTAEPMIAAALRTQVHYFDLTAEQGSALSTFERFDAPARERGIVVVPAAGFYGGFGDLLATAAMRGMPCADRIEIAIALDSWWADRRHSPHRGAKHAAASRLFRGAFNAVAVAADEVVGLSRAVRATGRPRSAAHGNGSDRTPLARARGPQLHQ